MSAFVVVIPARLGSTRLPGKPLRKLLGRELICHVCDRARESGAREVVVATDDERIAKVVRKAGVRAVMTAPDHASGTDRIAEVVRMEGWAPETRVINLQGDEPLIRPELLSALAQALDDHPEAGISTVATPVTEQRDLADENVVKVVLDAQGFASYFSRAPIPWLRGSGGVLSDAGMFLRHVGLYGYTAATLIRLAESEPAPHEKAERLEQLRALWLGIRIHVTVTEQAPGHGVDTEADLARVEAILRERR